MKFLKYEFTDEQWATVKPTLYNEDEEGSKYLISEINAMAEIGHICNAWSEGEEPVCTDLDTMYAVDVLLNEDLPSLAAYEVYPDPSSVKHTFGGLQGSYLESFCEAHPNSTHCTTNTT